MLVFTTGFFIIGDSVKIFQRQSVFYESEKMNERQQQISELYGIEFPADFYKVWDWYNSLNEDLVNVFHNTLGMNLTGAFDVLAGNFDNVELRYPALLHWRFYMDPPEFFTVISGDTDGLHWGYWFDDPGKLEPVVASWYARDAFEIGQTGDNLFEAILIHTNEVIESVQENIEYDPEYKQDYERDLQMLNELKNSLPVPVPNKNRRAITQKTSEEMGIVAPDTSKEILNKFKEGKELWFKEDEKSLEILEDVYTKLDRLPLAKVVRVLRENPHLPSVDILDYRAGDYNSFSDALKEPELVKKIEIGDHNLTELPDMSKFIHLEELVLWGNSLEKLPDSLLSCTKLKRINLFRNKFREIPGNSKDINRV